MKKALYLSFLAAIVLTGCVEGDYGIKPADPQKWEQEDPITIPGLTATAVAPIDLGKIETESVAVATATLPTLAEGTANLAVILDETARIELDENLKALKSDLQDAVTAAYGKRPVAREFSAVLNMDIMVDGQATLVTSEPFTLTVTPEAPFIASAYYLVGNMTGWSENPETLIKFKHSDEDVYEDPVFTVTFECDGGCYWKIIPQTNVDKGNVWFDEDYTGTVGVAVDGDDALEGQLIAGKCNAAKIVKGGKWQLTINMMEYTYSLKYIVDNYYLVGTLQGQVSSAPNTNGWYDSKDYMNCLLYPTSDDNTYTYTSVFGNGGYAGYKIWNESDYGNWDLCYGTAVNNDNNPSGTLVNTGAGSICLPTNSNEDVYTINIDLKNMTYSHEAYTGDVTRYDAVGIIGGLTSWGSDIDMTEVSVHNWCVKGVVITEATEVKFRANHDWPVNWGGQEAGIDLSASTYGVGKSGGDNFTIPAGTYDFYLNSLTGRYAVIAR